MAGFGMGGMLGKKYQKHCQYQPQFKKHITLHQKIPHLMRYANQTSLTKEDKIAMI